MPRATATDTAVLPPGIAPRLLTADQVAVVIGVSSASVREWSKTGRLPAPRRLGSGPRAPLRWDIRVIEKWLGDDPTAPAGAPRAPATSEAEAQTRAWLESIGAR